MRQVWEFLAVFIGALFIALSFNFFLIPEQLLSGGVSGISLIVGYLTGWNIGAVYMIANLPLILWGFVVIGRRFIILSVLSVVFTTWLLQVVPIRNIAGDPILAAVFGGVLVGLGAGISLRAGGSSGGFDILGSILTRNRDFPLGTLLLALNGFVVLALGYFKENWQLALYSMLSIYITSKVMDTIHIRHLKVTAFIVTKRQDVLSEELLKLPRGVTLIRSEGAYTQQPQTMLMAVITKYELAELKRIVKQVDPQAFVNIVETVGVLGEFRRLK